ncbi:MAG: DNA primase [Ignavibacteriaceae bacterium]|nr:DNA primase [Ignavibacteriaceae bacterium]
MQIPQDKIDEILNAADIVDVLSKYIRLQRSGANFRAVCPFHEEKTPSFMVSPKKQIYHCFGCGAGGNALKFVMDFGKLTFIDAIKELAKEYGISLPTQNDQKQEENEEYYQITALAAKYYSENLLNIKVYKTGDEYLKKRKISLNSYKTFNLGYSPQGSGGKLIDYFKKNKVDQNKAIELGILGKSEDGRIYERFSGRLIFTIFSATGREIAFAGRILEDRKDTGKYVNSPENPIYHKGRVLYGLSHAKEEIRRLDYAVLVEGYLDVITLHQNGIKNVVAVSGTSLTEEQVRLLSRFTKNFYLIFDSDSAGYKAAMRSIEVLLKQNVNIKIVNLPEDEDPDSFVRERGKSIFDNEIKTAKDFIDFQYMIFEKRGAFNDADKMTQAIRDMVKPIAYMPDELRKTVMIKNISSKFDLRESLIVTEIEKILKSEPEVVFRGDDLPANKIVSRQNQQIKESSAEIKLPPEITINETELIRILLEGNLDILNFVFFFVTPEEFFDPSNFAIIEVIYDIHISENPVTISTVSNKLTDEKFKSYLRSLFVDSHSYSAGLDDYFSPGPKNEVFKSAVDIVRKFKLIRIENAIREVNLKVKAASGEQLMRLFSEIKALNDEKSSLNYRFSEIKLKSKPN